MESLVFRVEVSLGSVVVEASRALPYIVRVSGFEYQVSDYGVWAQCM